MRELTIRPGMTRWSGHRSTQRRLSSLRGTTTTTEQKCDTVYDSTEKRAGYSVRYRLGIQEATVKMEHDPGDRIPVRDGHLDLDAGAAAGKTD